MPLGAQLSPSRISKVKAEPGISTVGSITLSLPTMSGKRPEHYIAYTFNTCAPILQFPGTNVFLLSYIDSVSPLLNQFFHILFICMDISPD
jgi:hypothetical protein